MSNQPKQLVDCAKHGPRQLGYVICAHVVGAGANVAHHTLPKAEELGEIFCADCLQASEAGENQRVFEMVELICAPCALARCAGRWLMP